MNDAEAVVSPASSRQSVGNCMILGNDQSTSLDAIWTAYCRSRPESVESCPRCLACLRVVALVLVYRVEISFEGSGEGVSAAATTTFGYDYSGQRVFSQTASSTTVFPSKYFSITSTTNGATTTATSTSYIFGNDQLVAYVEQDLINGTATGTPRTFYVHPDHVGSTNVITDENGDVVLSKDYFPYGATRVESGSASLARGYIGEFEEGGNLSYLNARYYEGSRGQFLSQDPTFLAVGDPARMQSSIGVTQNLVLQDPQVMNSYSYARNNPITMKDPNGNFPAAVIPFLLFGTGALVNATAQGIEDRVSGNPFAWENYAGAAVGGVAGTASLLSGYGAPAVGAVTSGVEDAATQGFSLATGRQDSYSPAQTLGQTAEGAFFGKYLNPKLAGVTVGSNSFKAVQGQIMTKLSNGTIQSFTPQTGSKMLTNQFVGSLPQSFAAGALGNSSILSSIQSQLSAIQKTLSKLIDSSKKK